MTVKASKRLRPHPGELLRSGLKQQEHLPPPATFVGKHYKLQNLQDGETFPSTTLGTVVQLQTAPAIAPTEAILSDLTRTACYNDFLPLSCRASNRGPRFLLGRPSRWLRVQQVLSNSSRSSAGQPSPLSIDQILCTRWSSRQEKAKTFRPRFNLLGNFIAQPRLASLCPTILIETSFYH